MVERYVHCTVVLPVFNGYMYNDIAERYILYYMVSLDLMLHVLQNS